MVGFAFWKESSASPTYATSPDAVGGREGRAEAAMKVRAGPEDFRSQSRGGKEEAVGRGTGQAAGGAVRPHLPLVDCSRAPWRHGTRGDGSGDPLCDFRNFPRVYNSFKINF